MKMHNKNCLIILGLLSVITRNQNYDGIKEWQNDKVGKKLEKTICLSYLLAGLKISIRIITN